MDAEDFLQFSNSPPSTGFGPIVQDVFMLLSHEIRHQRVDGLPLDIFS